MPATCREEIERIFRHKFAELNHIEIMGEQEFTALVDACLTYFIHSGIMPKPYSYILRIIDTISEGLIRSEMSTGIESILGGSTTFDIYRATHAAMGDVLKWLDRRNEQDPDKIGYIIDQYLRYWCFYFAEDYHLEDPSALKQFEPDLKFQRYKK